MKKAVKKILKIIGIIIAALVLIVAGFLVYNTIQTYKALNEPRLADNYYENFIAGGELECRYSGKGDYAVNNISVKSSNSSIKNIYIYYPAELESSNALYPLIMIVNGSQCPAKTYLPFFERLASWGFIVVGTDDPQAGTGETTSEALDYCLNESKIRSNIDSTNIGIVGYSQGGAGAINAVINFSNSSMYKTLFTGSAAYPLLATSQGWAYDPADIKIDYFMTASTGTSDDTGAIDINKEFGGVAPLASLIDIYNAMPADLIKLRGRCTNAEHGDMQERTDGYMTAWMLWELKGDEEASKAFVGADAEILTNSNWQDIEKNR